MDKIIKYLSETLKLIETISSPHQFVVQVGRTKKHAFNGRALTLSKVDNAYKYSINTIVPKGLQTDRELEVNRET